MQNRENDSLQDEAEEMNDENGADITSGHQTVSDENKPEDIKKEEQQGIATEHQFNELNDRYLRLYSEFDNYRKRTIKERSELLKTAAEEVFKAVLPVMDDFERAVRANEDLEDAAVVKEGYQLIYNKLKSVSQQKGLTSFESVGLQFNPDFMEAITFVPASAEHKAGTVIDEVEKGYKLGDKVIRFAKVVIAK